MKNKILLTMTMFALLATGGMTAYGEENQAITKMVTAKDGLIQIELPNAKWYAISSEENTAEFSDGDCGILLNVYKNETPYPEIVTADSMHEMVYEVLGSNQDYIYTIVGLGHDVDDYEAVKNAVNSAIIDYAKITPEMVGQTMALEEYSVSATEYTAWVNVNDELNVRSESSKEATAVAVLKRGDKVTVTGVVLHNGIENGWVKINTGSVTGYVSAQFLSTTEVAAEYVPETKKDAGKTGESKTLYFSDGSEVNVYHYSDDSWRSDSGVIYWGLTYYEWANDRGNTLYVNKPDTNPANRTGNTMTLYHGNSNIEIIYEYTDGSWRDDYGISYGGWPGNGYMTASSGEILYTYDPVAANSGNTDENQNITLVDGAGSYVTTIYDDGAADGSWTDNKNRYYRWNAFGTWICNDVYYYEG